MVVAIAAGGAAVLNTIEHAASPLPDEVRWLLVGSLAVAVLSIVCLTMVLEIRSQSEARVVYATADRAALIGVVLILAVGLSGWGAKASLSAMVALLLVPIVAGLRVWARTEVSG
jgi:hypothetical protein